MAKKKKLVKYKGRKFDAQVGSTQKANDFLRQAGSLARAAIKRRKRAEKKAEKNKEYC